MKQWKCPKCGGYEIEETLYPVKIFRYLIVDEYGDLDIVDEEDQLPLKSVFTCSMCDYDFPKTVCDWQTLEDFIGEEEDESLS